jgi:hypothetical protein
MIEVPLLDPKSVDPVMTKAVLEEFGMQASSSLVWLYPCAFHSANASIQLVVRGILDVISL